jgi:O-antigen ligase
LIGICCVAGARRPHWSMNYWLFLVYALYALASTIYSVEPLYTFASAVGTLGLFLFAIAAAQVLDMRRMAFITLCALTIFLLVSWIVDFAAPEFSRATSWSIHGTVERMGGIASHPNELARATAVFVVFVVILYRDRQLKWAPCFAALLLTAATMWATQSRTSAAAALQALAFVIVRRSPLLLAAGVLLLMIGGGIILLLPAKTLTELLLPFSRSGDFAELLNLTGRVDLWKFIWQKSMEAPLIGHGFNASEYFLSRTYPYFPLDWDPQDAHNMLLQTLLTLGFFGVALLGLFIWRLAVLYLNAPAPYRDAMLGLVLMIGVTGSGAFGVTPNLLTLMMLLTMAAADSARSLSGDGLATPAGAVPPSPWLGIGSRGAKA